MSRKSKQRKASAAIAPENAANAPAGLIGSGPAAAAVLAIAAILYFLVFYQAAPFRLNLFAWLLLPDEILHLWAGGDFAKVGISGRLFVLLAAATQLGLATIIGVWLVDLILGEQAGITRLEKCVFGAGVGLSLLSTLVLLIGLLGGLQNPVWLAIPLAAMLGAAGLRYKRNLLGKSPLAARSDQATDSPKKREVIRWWPWLAAAPFLFIILAGGMMPPWDFDVREYHLQAPKEWFLAGRIDFLAHNVYANMPLGAEMQALAAMIFMPVEPGWWWGALVGKTVMAGCVPLTALAIFTAGRRLWSSSAGAIGAVVYISIPWMIDVSLAGLNESVLAFYGWLALHSLLLASNPHNEHSAKIRWVFLAGIFAGSAAACKYTGVVFIFLPALVASIILILRSLAWNRGIAWLGVGGFLLAGTLAGGLWYAKNGVLTGNPTYPLLAEVFPSTTRTPGKNQQWRAAHAVPQNAAGNRYSADQAVAALEQISLKSDWLSPLLWPLFLVAIVCTVAETVKHWHGERNPSELWRVRLPLAICLYVCVFFVLWFFFTHRIDRFWLPVLPAAALLAGTGAAARSDKSWQFVVSGLLIWGLVGNFLVVSLWFKDGQLHNDPRYLVSLDILREDVPQEAKLPSRLSPVHRWLNENVKPNETVLLVGDAQPFDLIMPVLYNTCFDDCIFETLLADQTTSRQQAALCDAGIAYVVIDWGEIARYRSPGNYGFTDFVTRERVAKLIEQDLLVPQTGSWNERKVQVFRVRCG